MQSRLVKKVKVVGIILLFVGFCTVFSIAESTNENQLSLSYMKHTQSLYFQGNILYVGGDGPGNYSSIQDAINDSSDEDTVFVYNGTYNEHVYVNKIINLIGEDKYTTIIDAQGTDPYWRNAAVLIEEYNSNWKKVSGFTIKKESDYSTGIYLENSTTHVIMKNCIVKDSRDGIFSHMNQYVNIINCKIYDNTRYGIFLERMFHIPNNDNIIGCILNNNSDGIFLYGSYLTNISDCKMYDNDGFGIGLRGLCDSMGMCYSDCSDNLIENCSLSDNYYGVYLAGQETEDEKNYARNNIIKENNIFENVNGIYIDNLSKDNNIYHNNFINNTHNSYDICFNTWYNESLHEGNYFDDYEGIDDNGDGIGDTPYNISGGDNQDLYPFMNPDGWLGLSIVYVDDDFDESTSGWGYDHFDSIQDGVDAINESGMVYVYNGTYYENVIVNKIVNLIGEERNTTIIDGGGNGNVLYVFTDWINISGFTIRNSGIYDAGIEIKSNYNTISGNTISSNEYGIILSGSSSNTITSNAIMNNEGGIYLYKSSSNNITSNNISSNNYVGIFLWDSSINNITSNNISSNNYDGIDLEFSSNNNTITGNIISNNYVGIYFEFSNNNKIIDNNISSNNDNGVYLRDSSINNIIYHNNIINNLVNAADEYNNIWDNGYPSGGNYWDDYTGNDNNNDCIGDTPYNITSGINQDLYPFMYPNGWINHPPCVPYNPEPGPGATNVPIEVNLCWIGCDPDPCDTLTFDIYFGTSTHPPKVVSNQTETCFEPGILDFSTEYYWMVGAWDNHGSNTMGPLWNFNTEYNNPPGAPVIDGPTSGKPGDNCIYSFEAKDPEGHDIYYYIDWGDNTNTSWLGPYNSGKKIYESHSWSEKGTFSIKVKAKDVYEAIGEWGTFDVTMPKNRFFNYLWFTWLLDRFPILSQLFVILGRFIR